MAPQRPYQRQRSRQRRTEVPTAEEFDGAGGTAYVWYYIKGDQVTVASLRIGGTGVRGYVGIKKGDLSHDKSPQQLYNNTRKVTLRDIQQVTGTSTCHYHLLQAV